jgi:hypothetical protein
MHSLPIARQKDVCMYARSGDERWQYEKMSAAEGSNSMDIIFQCSGRICESCNFDWTK